MNLRTFQAGDEFAQLTIYNTAAASLPKFKPAAAPDLQRRVSAGDFDPATRVYAVDGGNIVGYCTFQSNGRVGYPWCLPGFEQAAEPLFNHVIDAMKRRGITKAFAAYRKDWGAINDFFLKRDFKLAREMMNYVLDFENMPTPSAKLTSAIGPARVEDVPAIFALDPSMIRVGSAEALKEAIWNNPWFGPESVFVQRDKDGAPVAAGIFIRNDKYADPKAVDSSMPCFRLGAFGTEGMTTKRIRGLFSFVMHPDRQVFSLGMDLLSYAANLLTEHDDISCYAAQAASDAKAVFPFYHRVFEKQGSFPVYERELK